MNSGLVFDIRRFCVHDGPGIRTTVFLKGCPLKCLWCHNPEGRTPEPETSIRTTRLDGITYQLEEITGKTMTRAEVMDEILRDKVFYKESGGGVTFSGGEPLMQPEFLQELLIACRSEGLHTAVDTCGHAEKQSMEAIAPLADLFLFDLKLIDEAEHRAYTGESNSLILDNFLYLMEITRPVTVRFPVVPGITDTERNVDSMIRFLQPLSKQISSIHLLPYHSAAKGKYARFGKEYKAKDLKAQEKAVLELLKTRFETLGIPVKIGG